MSSETTFTGIWSQDVFPHSSPVGMLYNEDVASFNESFSFSVNVGHNAEQFLGVVQPADPRVTPTVHNSYTSQMPFEIPFPQDLIMKPPPPGPSWLPTPSTHGLSDHTLTPLPFPDTKRWLTPFTIPDTEKRGFKCQIIGCNAQLFENRRKAQNHVCKHLGAKLMECSCGKKFSSHGTAKRHLASQWQKHPCAFCPKQFTRRDYRDVHQGRCTFTLNNVRR
ncbi:hypothetical protein K439DRAFT_1663623 [Ramaria rubella]|nr:hypothetical protein K439DRAFT_1663623 [Ramaria rubella]